MYQRVKEYIRRYHMLNSEDRVIAGVSGGADSICLLFMLMELKKEMGFEVTAVHVHHGLRGEAADADEAYVEKVCSEQGIRLWSFREDVGRYAKEHGLTLEEAGRDVRRRAFLRVLGETAGTKIALAHHQNDNVETLIWNLCRGCALRGMGGIAPAAGVWIRPLLCLQRAEIESYLEKRGISYCTDASNLEDDFTRNRIRNHVIPYLTEEVNSRSVAHMAEAVEQMRVIGEYAEQERKRYEKLCVRYGADGRAVLNEEYFRQVPKALQGYVLHGMLCRTAGRRKDIEALHVRLLLQLLTKQTGRRLNLPYGIQARRCYEGIELYRAEISRTDAKDGRAQSSGEEKDVPVRMRILERTKDMVIFPDSPYTKWFDYDIIKSTVQIRHREPGDRIMISKNGHTQKLKQYFINEKIPQSLRDGIWLAADGKDIMWVVGYRQSQKYQITDKTRRILEIEFYGGQDSGGEY